MILRCDCENCSYYLSRLHCTDLPVVGSAHLLEAFRFFSQVQPELASIASMGEDRQTICKSGPGSLPDAEIPDTEQEQFLITILGTLMELAGLKTMVKQ